MIRDTLIFLIAITAIAFTVLAYFRNKTNDRARHRRERMEEKREEFMESLRKKLHENKPDED